MSKIVFFCIPAHGHTNPTLNVVKELVGRGHQVWYYSYAPFREKIEAAGAVFVPCDDFDMEQKLTPKDAARVGRDLAFSIRVLVDTTLALDGRVCEDMARLGPDCIVADSMAVWGKMAAMKLGIPFVSSTTTFAFNRHSAKVMKQGVGGFFRMLLSMPGMAKEVRRLQERGYPVKSFLDLIQNSEDTHTIVYTSPAFQPCAETFSDKYAFVGPSIRPVGDVVEKTREKLVYASLGTVINGSLRFYKNCVEALGGTGYQAILSVGDSLPVSALGRLPENVAAYPRVDQIAVLEKADVFLTHCGMNSASEGLYFGVPLVMFPQTTEEGGVARRVGEMGAGVPLRRTDAASIRQAVEEALHSPSYRQCAQKVSEGFRACPGAKGAADKILEVCG